MSEADRDYEDGLCQRLCKPVENNAIENVLAEAVDPRSRISTIIDEDCGVVFWTSKRTDDGAEVLRNTYGVLAVEDDFAA